MATQVPLSDQREVAPAAPTFVGGSGRAPQQKKKLIRRSDVDRSQLYRRNFQGAFLLLNLWLGTKFYFWVRQ